MSGIFWWMWQIILTLTGCFFLIFGVNLLIAAYQLKHPSWFIMTFFASNLIILISAALLIGFIYRMIRSYRNTISKNKVLIEDVSDNS